MVDTNCTPSGALIGLRIDGGKTVPSGASAGVTFTSPPGTTIADFSFVRLLDFNSSPPLAGTRPLYALYQLGGRTFAGAGDYDDATRDRLKPFGSWYAHPQGDAKLSRRTNTLRDFGALRAGYTGTARTLGIRVGCLRRATDCSAPAAGRVYHVLYGADVTVRDDQPPSATLAAEGLLASGRRSGSDPVVLDAADNAGIRRVELYDVTGAARWSASEDYTATRNEQGATCSPRLAKPCPDLRARASAPRRCRPACAACSCARSTPPATRSTAGRSPSTWPRPSDRGARNGSGATDTATLTARYAGSRRRARTVGYGGPRAHPRPADERAGQPVGGAELALLTTNDRPGASTFTRKHVRTAADGTYRLRWRARASQRLELGWKSHVNDADYAAVARLRLGTRATATLRPSTRSPPSAADDPARPPPRARPRGDGDPPGPARRRRPLPHVRRHGDPQGRALPRRLPVPGGRLARARVPLPREDPRRAAVPVRDGVLARGHRARALTRARKLRPRRMRPPRRGHTWRPTS